MKVLDLQCASQHAFEGWFASEDEFQSQLTSGLLECPMCGDKKVVKMLSAPRLNFGAAPSSQAPAEPQAASSAVAPVPAPAEQAAFLQALRHVIEHTEDVGQAFADEARAMHYGDAEPRNIRGQTSVQQALQLVEEGIEILPLPLPAGLKQTLQ